MHIGSLTTAFFCALLLTGITHAAAPFYEGKTMRIVVGAAPGGGFDTYSRTIARLEPDSLSPSIMCTG
jgi:tripartite-type tricarboxylate transporter receptor subunit TctC